VGWDRYWGMGRADAATGLQAEGHGLMALVCKRSKSKAKPDLWSGLG